MTNVSDQHAAANDVGEEAPLAGIKVVELSMYVQGPVAGLALASMGAEVIKIEQVGVEDHMRNFHSVFGVTFDDRGKEWLYASLNRNKLALALDVRSSSGAEVFHRLIAEADVFVTNMRETALVEHGADADSLLAVNPQLVFCRGAGYGVRGPLAGDPCQDTVGMAYGGFMDTTATSAVPNYPPGSMSDILTGTNMASAVMAGLIKRARTGKGSVVSTSQTQALLWLQLQGVGVAANLGERLHRFEHDRTTNPLFTIYETSDGWIAVAALQNRQWPPMAEALGLTHLLDDPRFVTFVDVQQNADAIRPILRDHFKSDTTDRWWKALRESGAWVSPVNRVEDLASDANILANEYLVTFDDGLIGPPALFEVDEFRGARGNAAAYAEHTDQILGGLGYDEEEILQLRAEGAIW